jgi:hypothetical protein
MKTKSGYGSDKGGLYYECPECGKKNYVGDWNYNYFSQIHNDDVTCERCGCESIATTDYESIK